jgi:hypothetical protein
MDGGANICLTDNLNSLIDVTPIVPFPISVATKGSTPALDNFCTMQGLLPLPFTNGTYYNQLCYFCKNVTETIMDMVFNLARKIRQGSPADDGAVGA